MAKVFDSKASFPVDRKLKKKAIEILLKQNGKTLAAFLREKMYELIQEDEKDNK